MHYYLNEDKTIVPCDFETWASQLQELTTSTEIIVNRTKIGDYRICTIWVGINLDPEDNGLPKLFLTTVYKGFGKIHEEKVYSCTWAEACDAHDRMVIDCQNKIDQFAKDALELDKESVTVQCRHGVEIHCKECYEECQACGGDGNLPIPKSYLTCPCCRGKEKIRICRKCHGKGYE